MANRNIRGDRSDTIFQRHFVAVVVLVVVVTDVIVAVVVVRYDGGGGGCGVGGDNIGCPKKNFLALSRIPRIEIFFIVEITDKEPSLSQFWRNLVDVKMVKIRHLIGHFSYINKNLKNIFLEKETP